MNESEIVFFKDSIQGRSLPDYFKTLLTEKTEDTFITEEGVSCSRIIGGLFPSIIIHDSDIADIQQQESDSDCGWWVIYNACMFIFKGSIHFLDNFRIYSISNLGYRLRKIFEKLNLSIEEENRSETIENVELLSLPLPVNLVSEQISESQIFEECTRGDENSNATDPDFLDLISGNFVDKSLFIKEFIEHSQSCTMMTGPRKFGKSMNMSMLKSFLEAEADENGNIKEHNKYYSLFKDGVYTDRQGYAKTIKKLKISAHETILREHEGHYPIMHIVLNPAVASDYIEGHSSHMGIRAAISKCYEEHKYLLNDLKKSQASLGIRKLRYGHDISLFEKYLYMDISASIEEGIPHLASLMMNFWKRRVFVIVDEFDTPACYLDDNNNIVQAAWLLRSMYQRAFKGSGLKYIKKVVLVGVLEVGSGTIFSGFNNFRTSSVLSRPFYSYFGFTSEEIAELIENALPALLDKKGLVNKSIEKWYKGFIIQKEVMYNPLSIKSCLDNIVTARENPFQVYCAEFNNTEIINAAFTKFAKESEVGKLFKNQSISILKSNGMTTMDSIDKLDGLFRILLSMGYLTKAEDGGYKIPNYELQLYFYQNFFQIWVRENLLIDELASNIADLLEGQIESLDGYLSIIKGKILNKEEQPCASKLTFRCALTGLSILASLNANSKYSFFSEISRRSDSQPYTLFFPILNKSNTIIIQHCTGLNNANNENINERMEKNIWKIYRNRYKSYFRGKRLWQLHDYC